MATPTRLGRSAAPKKSATSNIARSKPVKFAKPNANGSILSFFQKAPKPEDSLFVGSITTPASIHVSATVAQGCNTGGQNRDALESRFNEKELPNKKRRIEDGKPTLTNEDGIDEKRTSQSAPAGEIETTTQKPKSKINSPFVIDSDSEDEELEQIRGNPVSPDMKSDASFDISKQVQRVVAPKDEDTNIGYGPPPLLKKETFSYTQVNEPEDLADLEHFELDEFEGEEMREMRFMQEQARLEAEEAAVFPHEEFGDDASDDQSPLQNCPICNGRLNGLSASDSTRHVNACLDGDAIPLPAEGGSEVKDVPEVEASEISKRFARAAVPRPGQPNPFEIDSKPNGGTSAFSKLMSGNAESSAWASAAAAESASRGRPAYERTCPFYKIIPGFSICVDAFRYGAVEGCEAYFLSHFHSDHYVGLTANWRHGPIYCSKITGGLVKQQLRTAAKWVVELEFEKPYDIAGTDGASVTMMPANHCPGSSLFLFEKTFGTGSNHKTKRILHCGDFRACPDHVRHPLLKPDAVDSITEKLRPQKIDICYLDTTYLNPRYSFPPQGDVIKACADLCGSMSPDPNCKDDVFIKSEKPIQADSMSKYFPSTGSPENKSQPRRSNGSATTKQRLLVVCGTYSIGKERICVAIAKNLHSKIFASPGKIRICKHLDDPELSALLTSDPTEAQVHMQMLMEIRAETLQDYLDSYKPHFSRIVGFRPSGWNFRHATGKSVSPNVPPSTFSMEKILHGPHWRTRFGVNDLVKQRGSTQEAMCFGVPYSEHSSFRELAMFVLSLRIEKIIPTVNVGSEQSRKRMKGWLDKWMVERRKGGLLRPLVEGEDQAGGDSGQLWGAGKTGTGGGAWW